MPRLLQRVRTEVLLAVSNPINPQSDYLPAQVVMHDLVATGRQVRLLYSPEFLATRGEVPADVTIGATARVTNSTFHNALIVDREIAVLWSGAGATSPYIFLIREPNVIRAIHQFTLLTWESAAMLSYYCPDRQHFDDTALAVLGALNDGLTDEVAARQLAVSLRTYRRHVADIMQRLDVTTRFQIGARAAELGLIVPTGLKPVA
ncbi:hypothetical protein [Nocardia sp. NBC_01327]|uniref:hypothetical protein n=1 Tax=Nocardia sp. NBC_01327 TaxID=2903593 RepID=UPI002E0DF51A|nr:hypothetical protein OG326_09385 [Nocardia sp. NBC_01327]